MGGEKLNRLSIIAAAFLLCGGFFFYNLTPVSAQSSDGEEDVASAVPGRVSEADILLDEPVDPGARAGGIIAQSGPTALTVLRMVLVLVLAAAAIYGVVFFFKRLSRPPSKTNPYLKVLASVPLGPGSFAAVISLGNKAWLVGGADGGVGLISEVADQELVDTMLLDESRRGADSGDFLNFSKILRRLGGAGEAGQRFTPESLRKRRERLKNL